MEDELIILDAFEGKEHIANRMYQLFAIMINFEHFTVYGDVTKLKDEIVLGITETDENKAETAMFIFKEKMSEIFLKMGVVIDDGADISVYETIAEIITYFEKTDISMVEYEADNLLNTEFDSEEEKLISAIKINRPLEQNIYILETVDVSAIFWDNLKEIVDKRLSLVSKMDLETFIKISKLINTITKVGSCNIYKLVLKNELSLDENHNEPMTPERYNVLISKYINFKVDIDMLVTDLYALLFIFTNEITQYYFEDIFLNKIHSLEHENNIAIKNGLIELFNKHKGL